jgi:hypothetical protein
MKVMIKFGGALAMTKSKAMTATMNSWVERVKIGCLDKQETTNSGAAQAMIYAIGAQLLLAQIAIAYAVTYSVTYIATGSGKAAQGHAFNDVALSIGDGVY